MKGWITGLVLAAATLFHGGHQAAAREFTMKFGTTSVNDPQTAFLKLYKEELEKRTNGRIKVELYPQGQLGPAPRQIEAVQLGSLEATMVPLDFYVGVDPRFGVFSVPMLFRDEAHAQATIHDPELESVLMTLAESKGLRGLAAEAIGFHAFAARTPILGLGDFKGKKLRINGTPFEKEKMARLGATGVGMPLSEVTPALSQGTVDGIASHISVFVSFKMSDLVGTVTDTHDSVVASLAVVSGLWFDQLPPDLQTAVLESAATVKPQLDAWTAEFNKSQIEAWTKMGGKIVRLPDEDQAELQKLFSTIGDDVTKAQPDVSEMLAKVRAAAAKH